MNNFLFNLHKKVIENTKRKFGSAKKYVSINIELKPGVVAPVLFTINQIKVAIKRAYKNREDIDKNTYDNFIKNLHK